MGFHGKKSISREKNVFHGFHGSIVDFTNHGIGPKTVDFTGP